MASLSSSPGYVELHARSAFSFLRGASLPETLATTAAEQGLAAVALCDRMGVYGSPRFRVAMPRRPPSPHPATPPPC